MILDAAHRHGDRNQIAKPRDDVVTTLMLLRPSAGLGDWGKIGAGGKISAGWGLWVVGWRLWVDINHVIYNLVTNQNPKALV